jgi:hypothetical protein
LRSAEDFGVVQVHYTEKQMPFYHFMTEICAIVGGAITFTGLLDGIIYRSEQVIRKKMELGKLG